VNSRTIWDAGGILGYCTDDGYEARSGLEHELKTYNVMFSISDIVFQDGNPMEGYWNWLKVKLVVKGGKIVVDKR